MAGFIHRRFERCGEIMDRIFECPVTQLALCHFPERGLGVKGWMGAPRSLVLGLEFRFRECRYQVDRLQRRLAVDHLIAGSLANVLLPLCQRPVAPRHIPS
jgi:hypothetical protein